MSSNTQRQLRLVSDVYFINESFECEFAAHSLRTDSMIESLSISDAKTFSNLLKLLYRRQME